MDSKSLWPQGDAVSRDSKREINPKKCRLDLGVFLFGQSSYAIFPLERLGLGESDIVKLVNSSCDCVRPTIVGYCLGKQKLRGIRLDISSKNRDDESVKSVCLGVEITCVLDDGRTQIVEVIMAYSVDLEKDNTPKASCSAVDDLETPESGRIGGTDLSDVQCD
jgi:hypothetical protein